MSRSIFGWSLPPGVTNRMIDEQCEGPCAVCCKPIDACVCPECTHCGQQGDILCYRPSVTMGAGAHEMKLNREQVLAREEYRLSVYRQQVLDQEMALNHLKDSTDWDPADFPVTNLFA